MQSRPLKERPWAIAPPSCKGPLQVKSGAQKWRASRPASCLGFLTPRPCSFPEGMGTWDCIALCVAIDTGGA
eukprot:1160336-Pelagomonas_calceolata.AAC.15